MELLKDTQARWQSLRRLRQSAAFANNTDPAIADDLKGPEVDLYAIDVSFAALQDKAEFEYLNGLPTTFVLPEEAVDRLRAAAGTIIMASPEFQRLLKEVGAKIVPEPSVGSTNSPAQLAVPMAAPVDPPDDETSEILLIRHPLNGCNRRPHRRRVRVIFCRAS